MGTGLGAPRRVAAVVVALVLVAHLGLWLVLESTRADFRSTRQARQHTEVVAQQVAGLRADRNGALDVSEYLRASVEADLREAIEVRVATGAARDATRTQRVVVEERLGAVSSEVEHATGVAEGNASLISDLAACLDGAKRVANALSVGDRASAFRELSRATPPCSRIGVVLGD